MDAPVLAILNPDGTPKFGLNLLTFVRTDEGKEYFTLNTDSGTTGQAFKYGAKVTADEFPLGINTPCGLIVVSETGEKSLVLLNRTPNKKSPGDTVDLSTKGFVHLGREFHVSVGTGGRLHQLGDGSLNLRLNIVKGLGGGFEGGNSRTVAAEKVDISLG